MSLPKRIRQKKYAAQGREWAICVGYAFPLLGAVALVGKQFLPPSAALMPALGLAIFFIGLCLKNIRGLTDQTLIAALNQQLPELEDSADLLFSVQDTLEPVQILQRQRITPRINNAAPFDLRRPWPYAKLGINLALCLALIALVLHWPVQPESAPQTPTFAAHPNAVLAIALNTHILRIRPPAYTGLASRSQTPLNAQFPEGAQLTWQLQFNTPVNTVALVFDDGKHLALVQRNNFWQTTQTIAQSRLYRVWVNGAPLPSSHSYQLLSISDTAPRIRILQPVQGLSLLQPGQHTWSLIVEADDDYALAAAHWQIQAVQGQGENISVHTRMIPVRGQGTRRRQRYTLDLALAAFNQTEGDDLIAQFSISDTRQPQANTSLSASYILRWPAAPSAQATGVDGLVEKTLPAYFRSQRQIIIDTEQLLREKSTLNKARFELRSDAIGMDQRLLRLRYGQFLGEEAEDPSKEAHQNAPEHQAQIATHSKDANTAILQAYGHVHDIPEAATLLEPKTKALLRAALNEMWQAELHLRQAHPELARPFEYRALGFIKQVQQAGRIYLARVGLELPPIDESRRLSGKRDGINTPRDPLHTAIWDDEALRDFWNKLNQFEQSPRAQAAHILNASDFSNIRLWLKQHPSALKDPIALLHSLDALQYDMGCTSCIQTLQTHLWPLMPNPLNSPGTRTYARPSGALYLENLSTEPAQ